MDDVKIYTLCSGSSGNSCYIKCAETEFLIDAGSSMRATEKALSELGSSLKNIKAIFVTHEHSDHIKGLKMISKYYSVPVYAAKGTAEFLLGDVPNELLTVFSVGDVLSLEDVTVRSFETPHDSRMSTGYIIEYNGRQFGYATDMGMLSLKIANMLADCEAAVVEANYDLSMLKNGPYPYYLKKRIESNIGHLDNKDCARLVSYMASHCTKRVLLAHLSKENNTPELALDTVCEKLANENVTAEVAVARRFEPTRLI